MPISIHGPPGGPEHLLAPRGETADGFRDETPLAELAPMLVKGCKAEVGAFSVLG